MDVKNRFIHGDIEEGGNIHGGTTRVLQNPSLLCRLGKSLNGLNQKPRAWYAKMYSYLLSQSFI